MVVCVNYEKWLVLLRNQQIAALSARHISHTTAKILATCLQTVEDRVFRCSDELEEVDGDDSNETSLPSATTSEIVPRLSPSIDLSSGLGDPIAGPHTNGGDSTALDEDPHQLSNGTVLNGGGAEGKSERIKAVNKFLHLLARDPREFVHWAGSRGGGEWTINFKSITKWLTQYELENLITARFGSYAARLVRILHAKGKLDEKRLGDFALLRPRDMRATLTLLQENGVVDIQSVPRDNNRQTIKTIFLWFFDPERYRRQLLHDTYKAITRLLQRNKAERTKVQAVIDKAERTDVIGKEDLYLTAAERAALAEWRTKEEKLLTQMWRLDDLVCLFRDFC